MTPPPLLVSVKEAARLLGVSVPTLYRMKDRGEIEWVRVSQSTRIRLSDVDRIANGEQP